MRTLLLGLCAAIGCGPDTASTDAASADDAADASPSSTFKVMTFNIKSGRESSLEEVAAVIVKERPDVVALQEVDVDTMRTGMVDQPHRLGQLTGMTNLFRTAIPFEGGAYGLAVLSEHPILSSTSLQLTSVGEQRILITVEIEVAPGRVLTIANTHFGLDATARVTQADEVVAAIGSDSDVLLFGDFNDVPDSGPIRRLGMVFRDAWALSGVGDGFTIPVSTATRRIDFIFLGTRWNAPSQIRVLDTTVSDHLPIVATLPGL